MSSLKEINGKYYQKHQVVMLTTYKKSQIYELGKLKLGKDTTSNNDCNRHLYILSDEESKEGDWVYSKNYNHILQFKKPSNKHFYKKVIATTDTSLYFKKEGKLYLGSYISAGLGENLPQPSQSFIKKYIEQYNAGTQITDVLVEYECVHSDLAPNGWDCGIKLDSNNTITITKLKDSYSREEIKELGIEFLKFLAKDHNHKYNTTKDAWEDWTKENL